MNLTNPLLVTKQMYIPASSLLTEGISRVLRYSRSPISTSLLPSRMRYRSCPTLRALPSPPPPRKPPTEFGGDESSAGAATGSNLLSHLTWGSTCACVTLQRSATVRPSAARTSLGPTSTTTAPWAGAPDPPAPLPC